MKNAYEFDADADMNALTTFQHLSATAIRFAGLRKRLLILGTGQLAKDLCHALLSKRGSFTEVVGFLDRDSTRRGQRLINPGIIGTYEQLFEVAERHQVHTIAVCLEDRRTVLPVQTLLDMKAMGLDVVDGHHLCEDESGRLWIDLLKPSALIFATGFRRQTLKMGLKRLIDLFCVCRRPVSWI